MPVVPSWPEPLARAYATCERLAQSHYENFPVASRLLPKRMRPHIAAVYAFARGADDIADEGTASALDRQAQLQTWRERLHEAARADRGGNAVRDEELVFVALGHTIRSLDLPVSLFDDLLSAFGQDTMTTRYASWRDVLDYCRRSANPVGRLVLRIAGYRDDRLDRSSDALCTALQLTNFWQDFGRDWRAGRLYVPRDVMAAAAAREEELDGPLLPPEWMRAIDACIDFTAARYAEGRAVCDGTRGRLRYELRLTWLGGRRILDRIGAERGRLLQHRPVLGAADVPALAWRLSTWKGAAA
jgi:squalene synthase HpnC